MSPTPSSQFAKKALRIVLSVLLLALMLRFVDPKAAKDMLLNASLGYVAGVILVNILDRVIMAWKWRMLLLGGTKRLPLIDAIKLYYISNFTGIALPFGAVGMDVIRSIGTTRHGVPAAQAVASIVVERALGAVGTLAMVMVSLAMMTVLLPDPALRHMAVLALMGGLLAGFVTVLMLWHDRIFAVIARVLRLERLFSRIRLAKYYEAFSIYSGKRGLIFRFAFLSFLEQSLSVATFYLSVRALDVDIGFLICLAVVPLNMVLLRMPISYAGIGLREGGYALLLGMFGIDYSVAVLAGFLSFICLLISILPGGVWLYWEKWLPSEAAKDG
jgi:uncharacterized protein (TIRG00374 family)